MKILVDENIPKKTVAALQALGHDVLDIRGTLDQGSIDERLWQMAVDQGRLLVTTDKGFLHCREAPHAGLLVVRLKRPNREQIHRRVLGAVAQFPEKDWPGLTIVMRDVAQSIWRRGQTDDAPARDAD